MSKNNKNKGFTLIEMMVAVSIFIIVAFIVTSALLTLSAAYKRSQKMRLTLDNLNFSLQDMSINLREGKNLQCSGEECKFTSANHWLFDNTTPGTSCYKKDSRADGSSTIFYCADCFSDCDSSNGDDIISPDIDISSLQFADLSSSPRYSLISVSIGALVGKTPRDQFNFSVQTAVAQRNGD